MYGVNKSNAERMGSGRFEWYLPKWSEHMDCLVNNDDTLIRKPWGASGESVIQGLHEHGCYKMPLSTVFFLKEQVTYDGEKTGKDKDRNGLLRRAGRESQRYVYVFRL